MCAVFLTLMLIVYLCFLQHFRDDDECEIPGAKKSRSEEEESNDANLWWGRSSLRRGVLKMKKAIPEEMAEALLTLHTRLLRSDQSGVPTHVTNGCRII